ncbi:MAG: hypothetical protein AB7K04_02070 [Pseudorhodoplanes sp.]
MWRSAIIAAAIYGYGHPGFDGYRPAAFDHSLQSFYQEVNHIATDGKRVLFTLDEARTMRFLKPYVEQIETRFRDLR